MWSDVCGTCSRMSLARLWSEACGVNDHAQLCLLVGGRRGKINSTKHVCPLYCHVFAVQCRFILMGVRLKEWTCPKLASKLCGPYTLESPSACRLSKPIRYYSAVIAESSCYLKLSLCFSKGHSFSKGTLFSPNFVFSPKLRWLEIASVKLDYKVLSNEFRFWKLRHG